MKISELGEFGLINLLAEMAYGGKNDKVSAWQKLIRGIGDDTTAWQADSSVQLATVDSLIQDIHFSLDITSWEELGWRAMAANLSDIAAMGGSPEYALVSLALPGSSEVEDVTSLYKGMLNLTDKFGVALVGGDTSSAPLLVINITIIGSTIGKDRVMLTRSAAEPGDKVAVTGYLGASGAGLEMLTKKLQLDSESASYLREAFLKPYPRVTEGQLLLKQGVKTAIDISDGLIADLKHICQASQVSASINIDSVPVHSSVRTNFADKALELALSGGEDYELLFTASADIIDKVRADVSCPITVIGDIISDTKSEVALVNKDGKPVKIAKFGWEHFTKK
ncbi:thiamine-phosphate kinase [Chloroflexota bacterium]